MKILATLVFSLFTLSAFAADRDVRRAPVTPAATCFYQTPTKVLGHKVVAVKGTLVFTCIVPSSTKTDKRGF